MRKFAEQEIVIPEGLHEGRRFRVDRQPWAGLWLDAVDSGRFTRVVSGGGAQGGKTLCCTVVPLMYHLFELKETVIFGLPTMELAEDKWSKDIKPAIESSRFRELLPRSGRGSQGGTPSAINFANGATLRFMTAGGKDKKRSGYTARVVIITETDGMDESSETSREADKVKQLEARTLSYGQRRRIYMESTFSTEQGRTWAEYDRGTASRIHRPCPRCGHYVALDREHLQGWQKAESEAQAEAGAYWACPDCGEPWTDAERLESATRSVLVHRGQRVTRTGKVKGDIEPTKTLGFRFTGADNHFLSAGDFGAAEWLGAHATDPENSEKELCQFWWGRPYIPQVWDLADLSQSALANRMGRTGRGIAPDGTACITVGVDLGKYFGNYGVIAWGQDGGGTVIDYGEFDIPSRGLGVEAATYAALNDLAEAIGEGWPNAAGQFLEPTYGFIDSGYADSQRAVYRFCRDRGLPWLPVKGYGHAQDRMKPYSPPKKLGGGITWIGEGHHCTEGTDGWLVHINADYWKSWIHRRITIDEPNEPRVVFYSAGPNEHLTLARHLTAEKAQEEFVSGKGMVTKWVRVRRQNHYFDTLQYAAAAGNMAGVTLVADQQQPAAQPAATTEPASMEVPYMITAR